MNNLKNDQLKQLEDSFYNDGYRLAKECLSGKLSTENIHKLLKTGYRYIDNFLDLFLQHSRNSNVPEACTKGCSFCCSQSIFILPHEVWYLKEFIKNSFTDKEKEEIRARIKARYKRTKNKNTKELANVKIKCALLRNDVCSVYDASPLACRIYLSKSADSCRQQLLGKSNEGQIAELYALPLKLGRMFNEGVVKFLTEKHLDVYEWTLESNLLKALNSTIEEWLNSVPVFSRNESNK